MLFAVPLLVKSKLYRRAKFSKLLRKKSSLGGEYGEFGLAKTRRFQHLGFLNPSKSTHLPGSIPRKAHIWEKVLGSQGRVSIVSSRSHPDENDSHSFQGIQSHYNTYLTQSQVIYIPFFVLFSLTNPA